MLCSPLVLLAQQSSSVRTTKSQPSGVPPRAASALELEPEPTVTPTPSVGGYCCDPSNTWSVGVCVGTSGYGRRAMWYSVRA